MSKLFVLGIMTGTSCDGADLALLQFTPKERLIACASKSFPKLLRSRLLDAQSGLIRARDMAFLQRDYSLWLAAFCKSFLKKHQNKNTIIAVHGQTIWHSPPMSNKSIPGISLQLIDPCILSFLTNATVTSYFRQPDLARGGQGAPLVPYYHWLRTQESPLRTKTPLAIHNLGGISNLTVVTPKMTSVIAFDTGPGNVLMDLATKKHTKSKRQYDANGTIAKSSINKINWAKIKALSKHRYFKQKPPKSTGKELFNQKFLNKLPGSGATLVSNATALTAYTMASSYKDFVLKKHPNLKAIYLAGGGAKNKALVSLFETCLHQLTSKTIPVFTLPNDFAPFQYLEAIAFARLGFEAIQAKAITLSNVTGASEPAFGAGIFPGKNFVSVLKTVNQFRKN